MFSHIICFLCKELCMRINQERLWKRINELGKIGQNSDGSVTRWPYTLEDEQAKELLIGWMKEAHLEVKTDAVGNVIGTLKGQESSLAPLVCGSHYDSVKNGGIFDGCLGVIAGIEVAQCLYENGMKPLRTLHIIGFEDEEGNRFGYGMIGSKSICGLTDENGLESCDQNGISLRMAGQLAGYDLNKYQECVIHPIHSFIELHIEQGRVLEKHDMPIGIVSAIAGLKRFDIEIYGESGHAGATPMYDRIDPIVSMSQWILKVTELSQSYQNTVATIGKVMPYPGAYNIICQKVYFSLDLRSASDKTLHEIVQKIEHYNKTLEQTAGIHIHMKEVIQLPAVQCDMTYQQELMSQCKENNISAMSLMSGAGHDCMNFKEVCPTALIFVRSQNGYSHRKEEYSHLEDCAKGCEILYQWIKKHLNEG